MAKKISKKTRRKIDTELIGLERLNEEYANSVDYSKSDLKDVYNVLATRYNALQHEIEFLKQVLEVTNKRIRGEK